MLALAIFVGVLAIGVFCWLMFTAAIYALSFAVAFLSFSTPSRPRRRSPRRDLIGLHGWSRCPGHGADGVLAHPQPHSSRRCRADVCHPCRGRWLFHDISSLRPHRGIRRLALGVRFSWRSLSGDRLAAACPDSRHRLMRGAALTDAIMGQCARQQTLGSCRSISPTLALGSSDLCCIDHDQAARRPLRARPRIDARLGSLKID